MAEYTTDAIDKIEKALCERYNVATLDEPLASAIKAARDGQVDGLRSALDGRLLFQWQETIDKAWAEAGYAQEAALEKPLARMNKTELLALAESREVEVPEGATIAVLRDLLGDAPAIAETPAEEPEAPLTITAVPEAEAPAEGEQEQPA